MNKVDFQYNGNQNGFVDETYRILSSKETSEGFHKKWITIWMSSECNSKCKHCYQKGSPRGKGWSYEKADEVTDLFLKDGYIVHPIVNEWLPTYWDFLKIKKKCGSTEITTNGILIHSRHDEFFPLLHENGITDIKFSIFPPKIHEYITARDRKNVLTATQLALDDGFRVTFNYVVMKDTLSLIPSFVEEAYNLGVSEIYFMYYFCVDPKSSMYDQVLSSNDVKIFWTCWQELQLNPKYNKMQFSNMASFGPNPHGDNIYKKCSEQEKFCLAGNWEYLSFLYMDPKGAIYPCNMLCSDRYKIGELYQESKGKYEYRFIENDWQASFKGFNRKICGGTLETARVKNESRLNI